MDNLKIIRHGGYFNLNLIRNILRDKSKSNSVRLKRIRKLFMSLPSEIIFFFFVALGSLFLFHNWNSSRYIIISVQREKKPHRMLQTQNETKQVKKWKISFFLNYSNHLLTSLFIYYLVSVLDIMYYWIIEL